jgi:essential nuclear protein 1
MGKDNTKTAKRAPRHDPLHAQLADNPEHGMRKATRQKFVDRNNKEEKVEVWLLHCPFTLLCVLCSSVLI